MAAFLNLSGDAATEALAEQHLPVITGMVKGYSRGHGSTLTLAGRMTEWPR